MKNIISTTQKKQLQFLDKCLEKEMRYGVGFVNTYSVRCKTCDTQMSSHCVERAISFVENHAGHATWVTTGGFRDGLEFLSKRKEA